MIRAIVLLGDGRIKHGGQELVAYWQAHGDSFIWLDMQGETAEDESQMLRELNCHPLAIEDVQRFRHPPKTETFAQHTLVLYRGITQFNDDLTIEQQTIALFAMERGLISVHAKPSTAIDFWWDEVVPAGLLRSPGFLACRIMHYSVGRYVDKVLEFEPRLTELEDSMQDHPSDDVMKELIAYKSRLRKLKRIFSYHEKLVSNLLKNTPIKLVEEEGEIEHALQDLYERCERLTSLTTMYFDLCGDLIEGYLSISSHNLNKTMQFLTVITAILGPLTIVVGVYGMNFDVMPELHWRFGYAFVWGLMLSIVGFSFWFFRRRRWL
ncbi:MAG TPA: magnesium transporter CorA family protein [Cellvibrionaceae bacterium]|nr:magnesium transporter CorA family protein [Cellvibrionaceae bacterium]HMW71664.1 magnesium transporter CorA family protein [Cellvibrionaceae bacterium]HMY39512.1 magnesium transporter CorA family protein [Marinagarivorans sp.]HNG60714.1 magnesium transporter CorA family protein [Cellvibrionaceae bacterium]